MCPVGCPVGSPRRVYIHGDSLDLTLPGDLLVSHGENVPCTAERVEGLVNGGAAAADPELHR